MHHLLGNRLYVDRDYMIDAISDFCHTMSDQDLQDEYDRLGLGDARLERFIADDAADDLDRHLEWRDTHR